MSLSPCVDSLRRTAWDSRSFFYRLNPCWFLQPEVMGTCLPGTGTWAGGPSVGLGLLIPEISLPNFHPHVGMGPAGSESASLLLVDGCGFFNSVVVRLHIELNF